MKSVKDILSKKNLVTKTVNENDMAIDAFFLMETENMDYAIVMENNVCVGIISEVDYMHKIILARVNPAQTKVKEIMTSCIHSAHVDEPIHRCLEMMDAFKIRHLLVFDEGVLKGVITLHDLMLAAFDGNIDNELEEQQHQYVNSTSKSDEKLYIMYN